MKDKREALILEISRKRSLDSSLQPETCLSDGWIADMILLRERSLREEITGLKVTLEQRWAGIRELEQENASLKATMGKVREMLSEEVDFSWEIDIQKIKKALAILNEAEGK